MVYQSLYRRYRPQKFSEIKGQDHVVRALQTAVRENKVGHAYLLHGPRGSGKTSTARVLAKALNCTDLGSDGEPCCVCESCLSIQEGRSFDLQELDAASNNKVDDMRALLERVNLTSPGRAKVYLLDEVHMLTAGAENALLKTLEEPPAHVTWVLATTEPHKVVQTIRSRCQVFELGLIGADIMSGLVRYVVTDAELDVDDAAIDHAVAAGGGSARDTLTALERVVAGGATTELDSSTDAILGALADHDRAAALSAVGDAVGRGRDPRTIGEMVLAGLRDAFLTAMGDPPARMSEHEQARAADLANRMAPAAMTRALETLGRALIDMRQAPDPRVDMEVALVRLCHPEEDWSLEVLARRVQQLEARLEGSPALSATAPLPAPGRQDAPPVPSAPRSVPSAPRSVPAARASSGPAPVDAPASTGRPAEAARRALSEHRAAAVAARGDVAAPVVPPASAPAGAAPPPPVPVPDLAAMSPKTPSEVVELARRHLGLDREFVVARAVDLQPDRERRREPAQLQALWVDLVEHSAQPSPEPDLSSSAGPVAAVSESSSAGPVAAVSESSSAGPVKAVSEPDSPAPEPSAVVSEEDSPAIVAVAPIAAAPTGAESPAPADMEATHMPPDHQEGVDSFDLAELHDLVDAPSHADDIEEKIKLTFPGAELTLLPDPDGHDDGDAA